MNILDKMLKGFFGSKEIKLAVEIKYPELLAEVKKSPAKADFQKLRLLHR